MATDPNKAKIAAQQAKIYKEIQLLIKNVYNQTISLPQVKKIMTSGEMFRLRENPAVERAINHMLTTVRKQMGSLILGGVEEAWKEGENQVWRDASVYLVKTEAEQKIFNQIRTEATATVRQDAAKAFFNERRDGLQVSDRIWNSTEGIKTEMEALIQRAMIEGKDADQLARELEKFLKDPDRLYRRVRNPETGQLELSEAAKKYKPGTGRYRSSYKNALRLASTEISRAYRQATWESYQNNPLIVGYEIQLSNNHTCSDGKGGIIPGWTDICDELQGRYPKAFRWLGWHPACRCRMIAVMISREEWAERVKARAEDKLEEWKPKNPINDMPERFKEWISKNQRRLDNATHVPYFIQDNFIRGSIESGYSFERGPASRTQPFTALVDETTTLPSLRNLLKEELRSLGHNTSVSFRDIDLPTAKYFSKELIALCRQYDLEVPFINFNTTRHRTFYGVVRPVRTDGRAARSFLEMAGKGMNVSDQSDNARLSPYAVTKSITDATNLKRVTLAHEFGHLIWSRLNTGTRADSFRTELLAIADEYFAELNTLSRGGTAFPRELREIYLGSYASQNPFEFMAEAFQEYWNRATPSKYALKVGELVDRYYKR